MSVRPIICVAVASLVGSAAFAGKGVRNRAGTLVTPTVDHRTLRASEAVSISELQQVAAQLSGRVLYEPSARVDRFPEGGLVFVDTTVPGAQAAASVPQRDAVTLERSAEGVTLTVAGGTVMPLDAVAAIPLAELPPAKAEPDQARLAASHPRVFVRSGDALQLITNDLRPDDQIGPDGILAWKLAWAVHAETIDLAKLLPDDPAGYRIFAMYAVDTPSGPFGAPVAWVLPWTGTALDTSRSGLAISWFWESVPGQPKVHDWFPYVRRLEPQADRGRRGR